MIRENHSKMGSNNLSICFAPCLFRAKDSAGLLKSATKGPAYTKIMLDNPHQIFGSPEVQEELYRKSYAKSQEQFYSNMDLGL